MEVTGSAVRVPGHDATSNPEDRKMWQAVAPALRAGGVAPPTLAEPAAALKLKEAALRDFLHRKSRGGEVMRVTPDRFYPRATLAALAATAQAVARASPNGMFTAAQYRDATGTGRGLAIQILEFLDTLGITQRVGDARKMRKDFVAILGAAAPAEPSAGKGNIRPGATARPVASSPQRPMKGNKR
ncbi:MAG: SelB C-terminal domain-containing protein [Betaproteobacteria bacterium]|nr:SelB C-terminal domain-containing protein [Betaproteobacteria bacterium]